MGWERSSAKMWETPVQFPARFLVTLLTLAKTIRSSSCQTLPANLTLHPLLLQKGKNMKELVLVSFNKLS